MTTFRAAPEVAEIVDELRETIDDHKPLIDIRIECVWKPKATRSKGHLVLGKARKISGLNAYLANGGEEFFVIEIALDTWDHLTHEQRVALVDHELCHLRVDEDHVTGEPVLGMHHHEIEEFAGVIARHGFWKSDVARFSAAVAEQLSLAIHDASTFGDELLGGDGDADGPET